MGRMRCGVRSTDDPVTRSKRSDAQRSTNTTARHARAATVLLTCVSTSSMYATAPAIEHTAYRLLPKKMPGMRCRHTSRIRPPPTPVTTPMSTQATKP